MRHSPDLAFSGNVILKTSNKSKEFWDHWEQFIESAEGRYTKGVIGQYHAIAKHLIGIEKQHQYPITFDSINYTFYERFRKYLLYEADNKNGGIGLSTNTVGKQFKNLKVFLRDCIRKGTIPYRDLSAFKTETEGSCFSILFYTFLRIKPIPTQLKT